MEKFISRMQLHLTQSVEMVVGSQLGISLLNINMGDVSEDHITIWVSMVYIMEKLILHRAVLEKLDVDCLMKEDREAYLLTASIKTSVDNDMVQATSAADQV